MTPKNQSKRGVRRARQNKSPINVISMTRQEAYERNLSTHSDSSVLRGKYTVNMGLTTIPSLVAIINPSAFGARATAYAGVFARYRIKELNIKFMPNSTSTAAITAVGILDDTSLSGDVPTTYQGITELRCSATQFEGVTVPAAFSFQPLDRKKWYYTTVETSGNDVRLSAVGELYAASTAAVSCAFEIDFSIVFSGASDVGSA